MLGYAPFLGQVRINPMTGPFLQPALPFGNTSGQHWLAQKAPVTPATPAPPNAAADAAKQEAENKILRAAGQKMINSGNALAAQLESTYATYKGTGNYWLAEAAASFLLGPVGPAGWATGAADAWWQSHRANQAVAALQAISFMANAWLLDMSEQFLPGFLDDIDKLDPNLGKSVSNVFDRVNRDYAQITKLLINVDVLPPALLGAYIDAFFGSLKESLQSAQQTLLDLLKALAALLTAAHKTADIFAKAVAAAPYLALMVGFMAVGYFFVAKT